MHALTVPWFWTGTLAVLTSPWSGWRAAVTGLFAMALAMFLQGRMHRAEPTPPVPFEGPVDVVRRIFAEQWITFPRFVFSGEFTRAWRATDG